MVRFHPGLLLQNAQVRQLAERLGPVTIQHRARVFAGSIPALGTEKLESGEPIALQLSLLTRNKWGARPTGRRLCCKQKGPTQASVPRFDSLVLHSVQSTWLGRQLADHFGLEPEMLWVRVPPELLKPSAGVVSNG